MKKRTSGHGMFAAHKPLKDEYGMIMACSQHINHKNAIQSNDHGMFAAR
jgi:hypothetical protein